MASRVPPAFTIVIDGKNYTTSDDDQQAASLIRLAGRDPKEFDLFLVSKHGIEERIRDAQIIDLTDGMTFKTRHKVHFTIDGVSEKSFDDDQEAGALIRLVGLDPTAYDLARVRSDGAIESFGAADIVRIADGDEFVTAKHVGGVA